MTKLELTEAFNITQRTPRRVAVKYIVMPLSQEEIDGCREAFNKFDKDGSGTVRDPKILFCIPRHGQDQHVLSITFTSRHVYVQQIDALELKATLNAMGQNPTEEEIFQMISQVDDDNSGEIEFAEFLKVIENQKTTAAKANDETDTIDAFIALGGQPNKTGEISTDKLKEVIKVC